MDAQDSRHYTGIPRALRLVLCLGLAFGIFAMHELLTGATNGDASHHLAVATTAVHNVGNASAVVIQMGGDMAPDPAGNDFAECCGMLMLCVAMMVGLGALLVLRARGNDRVLWQLPPPATTIVMSLTLLQTCSKTSLQRSSVLRC